MNGETCKLGQVPINAETVQVDRIKSDCALRRVQLPCVLSGLQCPYSLRSASVRPQLSAEGAIPMAIDIEHLKHFQSEQLEQKNIQTSARIPIHTRTSEWALIEIVILLTGISDSLKRMADRP